MDEDETEMALLFSRLVVRALTPEKLDEVKQFLDSNPTVNVAQHMPKLTDIVANHVLYELNPSDANLLSSSFLDISPQNMSPGARNTSPRLEVRAWNTENRTPQSVHTCSCPAATKASPLLELRKQRDAKRKKKMSGIPSI
jgi:hypothetical protein